MIIIRMHYALLFAIYEICHESSSVDSLRFVCSMQCDSIQIAICYHDI